MINIDNSEYGGFITSKNILAGVPIRYTFREPSSIQQFNGWTLLSEKDDDEYYGDPNNFVVLSAESIYKLAPVMLEIFYAPYGTDLFWQYERGVHVGFYDLKADCETTIADILGK